MTKPTGLRFGPLDERTVHLCIDMQNLFAETTPWHTPWMNRVLPMVERIAAHRPEQTIFTRFIPPDDPAVMPGSWQRYYRRWAELTVGRIEPRLLALVPPLARWVPPATVIDKPVYSPFAGRRLVTLLRQRQAEALVLTGAETDVCVLAATLDAVDQGYRVVLATEAICSSTDETHDALLTLYSNRFSLQIETAETEEILETWH